MKRNTSKVFGSDKGKLKSLFSFISFIFTKPGIALIKRIAKKTFIKEKTVDYHSSIKNKLDPEQLKKEFDTAYPLFKSKTTFSIILAIEGNEGLDTSVNSVLAQLYPEWELLLISSPNGNSGITASRQVKIITVAANATLASAYNTAIQNAYGDYILFLKQDGQLTINCLFEFVKYINSQPSSPIIYADEDRVDEAGNFSSPYFKPGWSPHSFLSRNYIGNTFIIKTELAKQLNFREVLGSELFDLLLRATEVSSDPAHISEVLFHFRPKETTTSSTKKALSEAMQRRGSPAVIDDIPGLPGMFQIRYEIKTIEKVSIIIPTKDRATLLRTAIDSILHKTSYPDYEIIVLNNNSTSPEFFNLINEYTYKYQDKFRCIDANFPFNFSKLMNLGVEESNGKYVLLLNNDIEVIHPDWMTHMVSYAQHSDTGAVGMKLLYPDGTIQHAGIVLGINGDAGHIFANMPKNIDGYYGCVKAVTNYSAVTGACLMCRKELYKKTGGMDEALAVEYNDFDLCLQFIKLGCYNVYLPTELYHHESATRGHPFSSKAAWLQHDKDFTTFKNKWQHIINNDPFYNPNLSLEATDFRLKYTV